MFLAVLGRQTDISIAELERVFGAKNITPLRAAGCALVNTEQLEIKYLGGTMKVARIIAEGNYLDGLKDLLIFDLKKRLQEKTKTKIGVSAYGINELKPLNIALSVKKDLKPLGKSIRVIPNKKAQLNTAQVLHNQLTKPQNAEYLIVRANKKIIVARTVAVQDIADYTKRDRMRPKRDPRVGMLPPKLAQILINLAGDGKEKERLLLDPFCGTGVVLQEALLMGFNVYGTDLNPKMIDYTKQNLNWLKNHYSFSGEVKLEVGDAQNHKWKPAPDLVASEIYLGPPLKQFPSPKRLNEIKAEINNLLRNFLTNLGRQIPKGTELALAVPAWQINSNEFTTLPIIDQIDKIGYNHIDLTHADKSKLIYYRQQQLVARQLTILEKA